LRTFSHKLDLHKSESKDSDVFRIKQNPRAFSPTTGGISPDGKRGTFRFRRASIGKKHGIIVFEGIKKSFRDTKTAFYFVNANERTFSTTGISYGTFLLRLSGRLRGESP
jgi:hypothetical protein